MALVRIPSLMRDLTGGRSEVQASGRTVRQLIAVLDQLYPGIGERLTQDGALRPDIAVAVDGETETLGLLQPVGENSEVIFLPAISGG